MAKKSAKKPAGKVISKSKPMGAKEMKKVKGGLLSIDGIKGESQDAKHPDTIEVRSFR